MTVKKLSFTAFGLPIILLGIGALSSGYSQEISAPASCSASDSSLVQTAGSMAIYLLRDGKKYHIRDARWLARNGYSVTQVKVSTPSELQAIPSGYELSDPDPIPGSAAALEEKLVAGPDGKIYLVEGGEKHWIIDGQWITRSRYAKQPAVPASDLELQMIPNGPELRVTSPAIWEACLAISLVLFFFLSSSALSGRFGLSGIRGWFANALLPNAPPWISRAALFVGFSLVIAWREPYLLQHPRFWAEEGTTWFQYAYAHSWMQSLFFVFPASGYFNLTANIGAVLASLAAGLFGVERAPAATTLFAFFIEIIPIGLILFGKSTLFDSLWKAVAGCAIFIFASTTSDEIWMNSINSMSFLGLISLVLLFEDSSGSPGWWRWGSRGLLVLCGLSSPYTAVLTPLFVVSAMRQGGREKKLQSAILIGCVLLQVGTAARVRIEAARSRANVEGFHRGTDVHLNDSVINVFFGHMVPAAFGYPARNLLISEMGMTSAATSASSYPPRPPSSSIRAGAWLCFVLIVLTIWHLRGPTLFNPSNMMIAVFLTFAIFTCVTSLYSVPYGRYAFLPGSSFLLLLLANIEGGKRLWIRYASMIVLSFGLASGILDYRTTHAQSGPPWSEEVRLWRMDHKHPLRVWPAFGGGILYNP